MYHKCSIAMLLQTIEMEERYFLRAFLTNHHPEVKNAKRGHAKKEGFKREVVALVPFVLRAGCW